MELREDARSAGPGRRVLAYAVIPLVLGLVLIGKVFLFPGCLAFENNDEVAHTFTGIPLAWRMLGQGLLPLINLYENFGTPLLGDPVTKPFALQALFYLVLPGPLAATVNRLLIVAFTASLLTHLYHRHFSLALPTASLCAVLLVLLPSFGFFSVHHPHQGSVLYFAVALVMQARFNARPTIARAFGAYAALAALALGLGMNPFLLALPFLVAHQFLASGMRIDRRFGAFCALLAGALLLVAPSLTYFFRAAPLAARSSLDYSALLPYTLRRLLADILFFHNRPELMHVSLCIFYSLPVLALVVAGLGTLERGARRMQIAILGVAPFLLVMFLLVWGGVRARIPFVKSIEITRLLWFANIYLLAAAGRGIEWVGDRRASAPGRWGLAALLALSLYALGRYTATQYPALADGLPAPGKFALSAVAAAVVLEALLILRRSSARAVRGVVIAALALSFVPVADFYLGFLDPLDAWFTRCPTSWESFFFHRAADAGFRPPSFLGQMEPGKRMTVQFEPVGSRRLQSVPEAGLFGTDGRSILMHGGIKDYLAGRGLIEYGWHGMTYHTVTADAAELERLGVTYVVTPSPGKFQPPDWRLKEVAPAKDAYLFESTKPVGLAYLDGGPEIRQIKDVECRGNRISVNLAEAGLSTPRPLVATFVNWPGWKGTVEGRTAVFLPSDDHFLRVEVRPGDVRAEFRFEPYTPMQILGCMAASVAVFPMLGFVLARRRAG